MTTDVCYPKKPRLLAGGMAPGSADGAEDGGAAAGSAGSTAAAARMLGDLARKCTCVRCKEVAAAGPLAVKCGHGCLCGKCAEELRGACALTALQCDVCSLQVRAEELKRDYATEKLLNAMKVLQDHIRAQESRPSLERARCADCLGKASAAGAADGGDGATAISAVAAAAKRCDAVRGQLERLAEDGDRDAQERRRQLAEAAAEAEAWRGRMAQLLDEKHVAALAELGTIKQRAEQLLIQEAASRDEARAAAAELRHLALQASAAAGAADSDDAVQASLRSAEVRAADLLARLSSSCSGSYELSRRGDPDALTAGFAALLDQAGVDLVVRPYLAALGRRPDPRPARVHRTGGLEPWDLGLLTSVVGLWYTPDGEVKIQSEPEPAWRPLPSPCLVVNYKGFKTKRLHLFDSELKEVASVRLHLKDGRLPGTIHVCNAQQIVVTVDHSRCKICQFDFTGRLIRKFGSSGSGPKQFRQPMTVYWYEELLYVVDSDNKRVQVFNAESQETEGSPLTHEGFSTDLHSVLVTESRVIVTDRDNGKAFVFDKGSRRLLREVALGGKPFSLTADSSGNLFVSLTNERRVHIYDPAMAHRLHSLSIVRHQQRRQRSTAAAEGASTAAASADGAEGIEDVPEDSEEEEEEDDDEDSSSSGGAGGAGFAGFLATLKMAGKGGAARGKPPFIYGIAFDSAARRLFVADTFCHAILAYQF